MKFKFLVAAASFSFLAASAAFAAPAFTKVDDTNSSSMQQMPSDGSQMPADNNAASVAPGPMADAGSQNVGAIPPSTTMPSDNSSQDPNSTMSANNMDPQNVSASSDADSMSSDTTTGDDDY